MAKEIRVRERIENEKERVRAELELRRDRRQTKDREDLPQECNEHKHRNERDYLYWSMEQGFRSELFFGKFCSNLVALICFYSTPS